MAYERFVLIKIDTEVYVISDLENKELIEKYEELGIEINNIFIELISRLKHKKLTEDEYGIVIDIAIRRCSELVRFNMGKNDIKKGFSEVADILPDENR